MTIVIDTCVLSEVARQRPERLVLQWLDRNFRNAVLVSPVIMELEAGAWLSPHAAQRTRLTEGHRRIYERFPSERRAVFDEAAARAASRIIATARQTGRPIGIVDAQVIGIAQTLNAAIATRDADFADRDVDIVNPWLEN